jgi:hypothetical protein
MQVIAKGRLESTLFDPFGILEEATIAHEDVLLYWRVGRN